MEEGIAVTIIMAIVVGIYLLPAINMMISGFTKGAVDFGEMYLLRFIGNFYSAITEVLLWIIPIIGAVAGYLVMKTVFEDWKAFLGIILGFIAGLLIDVLLFSLDVVFLNIRSSIKKIERKE